MAEKRTDKDRAFRFGFLLSEIEANSRAILCGREHDIILAMAKMRQDVLEAADITSRVSQKALDELVRGDKVTDA
jgi:hypothetical protein